MQGQILVQGVIIAVVLGAGFWPLERLDKPHAQPVLFAGLRAAWMASVITIAPEAFRALGWDSRPPEGWSNIIPEAFSVVIVCVALAVYFAHRRVRDQKLRERFAADAAEDARQHSPGTS